MDGLAGRPQIGLDISATQDLIQAFRIAHPAKQSGSPAPQFERRFRYARYFTDQSLTTGASGEQQEYAARILPEVTHLNRMGHQVLLQAQELLRLYDNLGLGAHTDQVDGL